MQPADPAAVYAFAGAFFDALARSGVRTVVVSPGSRSAPLAVSAWRRAQLDTADALECIVHTEERAAGFFALGIAKTRAAPVALICTSGTAAANYLPAVVEAYQACVPLVVLTADRPPELRDWGAGQTIQQVGLFGPHVRWFAELPLPDAAPDAAGYARAIAARAASTAAGCPAGPVHLNWPLREPLPPPVLAGDAELAGAEPLGATEEHAPRSLISIPRRAPLASRDETEWLTELVATRERGVVACGPLDQDPALATAIADFSRASAWPIIADAASSLRGGEYTHSGHVLAASELWLRSGPLASALKPGAVLRIGTTPTSKAFRLWLEAAPPSELVLLDPEERWQDPSHLATQRLAVDPTSWLRAATYLLDQRGPRGATAWSSALSNAEAAAQHAIDVALENAPELLEPRAVRELAQQLPDNALLYLSNSMPVRDADAFLPCSPQPLRVMANRGANGIDGVTSSALGAAHATGAPVVLLTGDLAFIHDLPGLSIAKRLGANLTIVVFQNDGGGIFSFLPIAQQAGAVGFDELFRTPTGLDLAASGALFGLPYTRVGSWAEFRAVIKESVGTPGPAIVEVPVDPEANLANFRTLAEAARIAATRAVLGEGHA